jgi:hypothetical protein
MNKELAPFLIKLKNSATQNFQLLTKFRVKILCLVHSFLDDRLLPSGVLRRREVSWRRIRALNDRFDWVANALRLTSFDPNSWIKDGDFARDGLHLNGRGKIRLGQLYVRVSGLDVGGSAGSKK